MLSPSGMPTTGVDSAVTGETEPAHAGQLIVVMTLTTTATTADSGPSSRFSSSSDYWASRSSRRRSLISSRSLAAYSNFNSADETPGSTHNDTLSQLVTELHDLNARSVTLGESSGPPKTQGVMQAKGTFDLARDFRFDVVDYEQIGADDWVNFPSEHWPQGYSLPRLVVERSLRV